MTRRWRYPRARRGVFFRLVVDIDDVPYASWALRRQRPAPVVTRGSRRGRTWGTVRSQVNPPWPTSRVTRRRPLVYACRRGHAWSPPWLVSQAPLPPAYPPPWVVHRQQRMPLVRKFRTWDAPIEQTALPGWTDHRRLIPPVRRGRSWVVTRPQVNPPWQPTPIRQTPRRLLLMRHGRTWWPLPVPQQPITAPSFPPPPLVSHHARLGVTRRGRFTIVPPPPPAVPTSPVLVPGRQQPAKRGRPLIARRGRYLPTPAPVQPPRPVGRRRATAPRGRHGYAWVTVPGTPRPPSRLTRRSRWYLPRHTAHGWQVVQTAAAGTVITPLPVRVYGPTLDYTTVALVTTWMATGATVTWDVTLSATTWRVSGPVLAWTIAEPEVLR